jgi:hypothetical protein
LNFSKLHFTVLVIAFLSLCGFVLVDSEDEMLLKIAKEYKKYEVTKKPEIVVTDSAKYKWTVALCTRPKNFDMGWHWRQDSLFMSKTTSEKSPHGDKLYKLYVKYYKSYRDYINFRQPMGQVLVKETWNVQEVQYDSTNKQIFQVQSQNDRKWYMPTTVSDLFIMYKGKETPNNDKGWIYGIVDVQDGQASAKVLYKGKISSCIGCHKDTKYDRIFGR